MLHSVTVLPVDNSGSSSSSRIGHQARHRVVLTTALRENLQPNGPMDECQAPVFYGLVLAILVAIWLYQNLSDFRIVLFSGDQAEIPILCKRGTTAFFLFRRALMWSLHALCLANSSCGRFLFLLPVQWTAKNIPCWNQLENKKAVDHTQSDSNAHFLLLCRFFLRRWHIRTPCVSPTWLMTLRGGHLPVTVALSKQWRENSTMILSKGSFCLSSKNMPLVDTFGLSRSFGPFSLHEQNEYLHDFLFFFRLFGLPRLVPRSWTSDLHQSIRDFFGQFLFFASFFASRTLRTTLFLRGGRTHNPFPAGTVSTDTLCSARDAKHHTLVHHCKILFCNESTADSLPFQNEFSRLSGFCCLSVELSLRTGLFDLCSVPGPFCDEVFKRSCRSFWARAFGHPRSAIFAFYQLLWRVRWCCPVLWTLILRTQHVPRGVGMPWRCQYDTCVVRSELRLAHWPHRHVRLLETNEILRGPATSHEVKSPPLPPPNSRVLFQQSMNKDDQQSFFFQEVTAPSLTPIHGVRWN